MENQTPNAGILSQQIDPQALNLARSIALAESGNGGMTPNYNAVGDNGTSKGAYQWQPGNFQSAAIAAGLNPSDMSPENQDKVAYSQVKAYKDKGYQPAEIASLWNSGQPNNWQNHAGTTIVNGQPLNYNTPAYVQTVKSYYSKLAGGTTATSAPTVPAPSPTTAPAPTEPTLGAELEKRGSDIKGAFSGVINNQINPLSGGIQVVGGVAGGLNDVVNKGLELIPGVKNLESFLGGEIGKLSATPVGQSVAQSIQAFSQAHPELASDIGSGFNIATAIPIFAGLGAVKDVAAGGLSSVLRGVAEKGATNDIVAGLGRTVGGRALVDDTTGAIIKNGLDVGAVPAITAGKFDVEDALARTAAERGAISENELQPILDSVSTSNIADRVPLATVRADAVADAQAKLQSTDAVNTMFDRIQQQYGDYPTLAQLNTAKQLVSQQVPQRAFDLAGYNANYVVRQNLQTTIEDAAKTLGLPDVGAINAKMRLLYNYDDILNAIDGKPVAQGLLRTIANKTLGAGIGTLIGKATGGGLAAEIMGGLIGEPALNAFSKANVGGLLGGLLQK